MYKLKEIADKVYYVGVNDRQKALFENMWPLPYGVSYNSYLIVDEKTVLVDTVDVCYSDIFLKKIADALDGRPLDFLIVNHMEPDHAGSIRLLDEYIEKNTSSDEAYYLRGNAYRKKGDIRQALNN